MKRHSFVVTLWRCEYLRLLMGQFVWDCSSCFAGQIHMISISLLCLLAVLLLVIYCLFQIFDIGKVEVYCYDYIRCFLCVLYSFARDLCWGSSDWRWSLGVGSRRQSKWIYFVNNYFFPYYFTV